MSRADHICRRRRVLLAGKRRRAYERWWAREREMVADQSRYASELVARARRGRGPARLALAGGAFSAAVVAAGFIAHCGA